MKDINMVGVKLFVFHIIDIVVNMKRRRECCVLLPAAADRLRLFRGCHRLRLFRGCHRLRLFR